MNGTTIKLPKKVIDSDWKDDIDYQPYEEEKTYVSPTSIKRETINKIKKSPIKLAIRNMVDWNEVSKQITA
ncbi:hypothetical protein IKD49_00755 [Candidatus Saccharibacteria bacterium]|nr:hypothetical protein [Candidatus Saccharibacteria bacterium]MBR2995001.1 hypothetical protein [Candidatus Saccharibacteria bacterium]MBR2995048.1 hypothetical protein [Candidatus Saccharibacteria bacterium]